MDDTPKNTTSPDTSLSADTDQINKLFDSPSENNNAAEIDGKINLEDLDNSFNKNSDTTKNSPGLAAILNSGKIHSERLPILDVVFDRLVRLLTTSLRNFTSDNVEVSCSKVSALRFADYLNSVPMPTLIGIFKANQWDTHALITIDDSLICSIIDVLLGGRKSYQVKREIRPYTTIERNLVQRLIQVVLNDFKEAFSPVSEVDFSYERLESNPSFAAIVRTTNVTAKITFKIEMDDRGGHFDIVIPYSSIEPIRDLLLQNFMGEKFGRDDIWESHLESRIREANVNLEAALPFEELSLREVLAWKKGSYLQLSSTIQSTVYLSSDYYKMLSGRMGQKNGHIAIKVNDILFGKDGEAQ